RGRRSEEGSTSVTDPRGPEQRRTPQLPRVLGVGTSNAARRSPLGDRNLRADFLELFLDPVGLFLVDAFLDRLRRALDEILCFLEAQAGDLADDLDDLDLVRTHLGERDIELGLLFHR